MYKDDQDVVERFAREIIVDFNDNALSFIRGQIEIAERIGSETSARAWRDTADAVARILQQ
jgi:hypothetical protein